MGATSLVKVTAPETGEVVCALKPPLARIKSIKAGELTEIRSESRPVEFAFMLISPVLLR
jgi:hypothetical protein